MFSQLKNMYLCNRKMILQGRVQIPTGGIVRDSRENGTEPLQLRHRQ